MDRNPVLADGQPWRADAEFRLLVVQRSARGRFRHLIPLWARMPGWVVRTADRAALNGPRVRGDRPHAVLVDAEPACAGLSLRLFPEARQVLHVDEHFDPAGAAGFDVVACAHWWQRERMPAVMRPNVRVIHPGIPAVQALAHKGLHTLDGRWLTAADRPLVLAVDGWEGDAGARRLPALVARLLERLGGALLLVVPPDGTPGWRILTADSRVHCVADPGEGRRAALLQMSTLFLGGPHQPDWLLEAMAAGCPVLAQSGQAARELIRDGVSGCLLPPEQRLTVLADVALALLDDETALARMAREAQAEIRREFDLHAAAARYARLFGAEEDEDSLLPAALAPASREAFSRPRRT